MKKIILAVLPVFFLLAAVTAETYACNTKGCTPGYWKQEQHEDSWRGDLEFYNSKLYVIFDCHDDMETLDIDDDMLLSDALRAKGGGTSALLRHAVAAYLNGSYWAGFGANGPGKDPSAIAGWFCKALSNEINGYHPDTAPYTVEQTKNWLEKFNELQCDLD